MVSLCLHSHSEIDAAIRVHRRRCRLHTGMQCSTAIWDASFSCLFFLPFFLGTRAMRCGSLLHVCLTLGVCLFITHLYFFFGGGAFVLFRNTGSSFRCESQVGRSFSRRNSAHSNFFQKHLDVGCLTTIRYADAWHQQCTCFFSRCIKSSLSRCCVLDLVNAAFPFLGLFFFFV